MNILANCLILCSIFAYANGIMWLQEPNTTKCLGDDMRGNVLVLGEYQVSSIPNQTVDYVVRDTKGHILSQHQDITKGKFAFVTETYDTFEICFISRVPPHVNGSRHVVSLQMTTLEQPKSYEGIVEGVKLKAAEVEWKKLKN